MFEYKYKVGLEDTDAAGVLFFAKQFGIIHRAYEELLESCGFPVEKILREGNFALPIVHAESDYLTPVRIGDLVSINIVLKSISQSTFILKYEMKISDKLAGAATTVHTSVNPANGKKIELEAELKLKLSEIAG